MDNRILLLGPPGAGKSNVSDSLGWLFTYLLVMEWMERRNLDKDTDTAALFYRHYHRIAASTSGRLTGHFVHDHKGTISPQLLRSLDDAISAGEFHFHRISTGEVLRERIRGGILPEAEKERVGRGELVSDEYVHQVLDELLEGVRWRNFLLDGYPRTPEQLDHIWSKLREYDEGRDIHGELPIDHVVHVTIEREEAERRILGRRVCPTQECEMASHSYNIFFEGFQPRKVGVKSSSGDYETGVCDACGAELIRRDDDSPDIFDARWGQYEHDILPLMDILEQRHWIRIHDVPAKMPRELMCVHMMAHMGDLKSRYILGM